MQQIVAKTKAFCRWSQVVKQIVLNTQNYTEESNMSVESLQQATMDELLQ